MSLESGQLLLRQDTTVTCPKCANECSLDQGFAQRALEQLSDASSGAIAAMREAERAQVERRAELEGRPSWSNNSGLEQPVVTERDGRPSESYQTLVL
jgi:hypothetical protein